MDYFIYMVIIINIFIILAISQNLLVGFTGLFSVCQAAFYGIGAYIAALLAIWLTSNLILAVLAAMIVAGIWGAIISLPSIRLKGDYFLIASIGFQMVMFSIFLNWKAVTRGPMGLYGLPRPHLFGFAFDSPYSFLVLSFALMLACFFLSRRIAHSPFGLALKGIRDDETAVEALGKNVIRFKIAIFSFSAAWAAVAGALFAFYTSSVDPFSFTLEESVFILTLAIVGGTGNLKGSVVGAIILISLPELMKFIQIPDAVAAQTRQIFYGLLLILFMRFRSQGLIGEYRLR
jgi:branched-chain amino acid transport system permease protein